MKKFKHKKTGLIVSQIHPNKDYYGVEGEYHIHHTTHKDFIEDSNDWEEITEKPKDYEILFVNLIRELKKLYNEILAY